MNARELIDKLSANPTSPLDLAATSAAALPTILRALRLLAAAEGGEGTPETDALHHRLVKASEGPQWIAGKDYCDMKDHARTLEQRCAALAARVRELERMVEDARNDMDAMRKRHADEMARFGCPFVNSVVSREDGYFIAHQIIDTHPTPDGLMVVIAIAARSK